MTTEDNVKALILSDAVKFITELKSESDFRIGPRMRAKYTLFAIQIWVDSFATYAYSHLPAGIFYCFRLKNNKNSTGKMRQLYTFVANESTLAS